MKRISPAQMASDEIFVKKRIADANRSGEQVRSIAVDHDLQS